jgi:hypothetical protein
VVIVFKKEQNEQEWAFSKIFLKSVDLDALIP